MDSHDAWKAGYSAGEAFNNAVLTFDQIESMAKGFRWEQPGFFGTTVVDFTAKFWQGFSQRVEMQKAKK